MHLSKLLHTQSPKSSMVKNNDKQLVPLENIVIKKRITTQVSKANYGWNFKKIIQYKYMVANHLIISLHNFIIFCVIITTII